MDQTLFDAARTGDIATLELLLQQDPLLLDRSISLSPSTDNPLHVSVFSNKLVFTKKILDLKPSLAMEVNPQGFTPLHIASSLGNLEIVKELLRVGELLNVGNPRFWKGKDCLIPLHCAAQRGRCEVIKELVLSCPESLKEVTKSCNETALHLAVKNSQVEATQVLLEEIKKQDMVHEVVNLYNKEGNTVLHLATLGKQVQIVEMLIGDQTSIIKRGIDVNFENNHFLTPKDILELLLQTEDGKVSETLKIAKILDKSEAKNGKEKRRTQKQPSFTGSPCRKIKKILDWQVQGFRSDERETLLVVATLIATLTFTGMVQPPGSFKGEDNNNGGSKTNIINSSRNNTTTAGKSVMADDQLIFSFYTAFNAIGFLASVSVISVLTRGFPLRNWMRLCIISMVATYVIAIFYMAPNEKILTYVVLGVSALVVLREIYLFLKWLFKMIKKF